MVNVTGSSVVRHLGLVAGASMIAIGCSSAAYAQGKPAGAADAANEEIVVTAQFRNQKLQDVPIAITAVSGETLEARNQSNLVQVANQAPSVQLVDLGGAFGPSMSASIRGVGQGDFDPALEPGVGIYIDDVYYASLTGSNFDLIDLDRVEVLRGPQGTLSGRNSEGGSIKLFSKKPNGETDGSLVVSYGTFKKIDVRGAANLTLVPDALFMRISGVAHSDDGYVSRVDYGCAFPASGVPATTAAKGLGCEVGREGGKTFVGGRAALRYAPTGSPVEINLSADYTRDTSPVSAVTLLRTNAAVAAGCTICAIPGTTITLNDQFIPTNPYVSYASFTDTYGGRSYAASDQTKTTNWGVAGTIDWDLGGNFSVKSITAYRAFDAYWQEDNDISPTQIALGFEHLYHNQFSEELRLSGAFGADKLVEWTLGGYYFKQTTTYPTHQVLNYAGPFGLGFYANDPVNANSKAAFLNGVVHITPALNLNAGIRYTTEEKTYHYTRIGEDGVSPAPLIGTVNGASSTYKGHQWDYRVNLDYHVDQNLLVYASFSTGFKGGGTNPRPFFGPGANLGFGGCVIATCQLQAFKPETLKAYEIGAKASFFDRKITLNLAGYVNNLSNLQATLLNCPANSPVFFGFLCALPVNAGTARIKGVEVEAVVRPVAGFQIDGSFSYTDFKFTSVVANTGILLGSVAPGIPLHTKWSIGAQYEASLGENTGSVMARIDVNHQDLEYTNSINSPTNALPGYTVVNARLAWTSASRDWEIFGTVNNLANKLYYTSVFDVASSAGFAYGTPARPREWTIGIKRRF
ncbi:MAG: TonB-dependent receptor [Novosphingobium sp.]